VSGLFNGGTTLQRYQLTDVLQNGFRRDIAMIPQRFVTEYPQRCGQLLGMLEPQARDAGLVGSFALLVASAAVTMPFGRMTERDHPLGQPESGLFRSIRQLRRRPFLAAPFWAGIVPKFFRYAKIVNDPEFANGWRDEAGNHPIHSSEVKDGDTVLRTIRHALAHGNVVYLDEHGHEIPGKQLRYLAFLSEHEDGRSHRVAIFGEEDFLHFLKSWILWLQTFPPENRFAFGEAAE
jgi:hypothetical protein